MIRIIIFSKPPRGYKVESPNKVESLNEWDRAKCMRLIFAMKEKPARRMMYGAKDDLKFLYES